jgi:AAA domain-containing protein
MTLLDADVEALEANAPVEAFRRVGLTYVWDPEEYKAIRLMAEGISDRTDSAEITILDMRYHPPKHLALHRQKLLDLQARRNFSQTMREDCGNDKALYNIPWKNVIEKFCMGVVKRHREGDPTRHVKNIAKESKQQYLIDKVLPLGKPTIWYGPQGAGKGWLAAHAACSAATATSFAGLFVKKKVNVLYLDWEDSDGTFVLRVDCVLRAKGLDQYEYPNVFYRKMHGQLPRQLPTIMREVSDKDIGLVIIDSVGLAMGAKGDSSYEDHAISFFEALRFLEPATILLIDHVTGADYKSNNLALKALGSVYKMAEARAGWEIRKEQDTDSDDQIIAMHNTKHNHSKKYASLGLKLTFDVQNDDELVSVKLEQTDLKSSTELIKQLTPGEQILALLSKNGASSVDDVAEEVTEDRKDVARAQLTKLVKKGLVIKLPDGRYGLPDEYVKQPTQLKVLGPVYDQPEPSNTEDLIELPW